MPTATETKPSKAKSPAAELAALDAAATAAKAERDRIVREAREHEAQLSALERALNQIAHDEPTQFNASAEPKPNTKAAKINAELQRVQATGSRWPALITGAETKLRAAERAASHHRAGHAIELARIEFQGGEDDLAELDDLAEQQLAVLARIRTREARLIALTTATPGRIDGRDIKFDPRLADLTNLLADHPTFYPPRSRSLTPLSGEVPPLRRSVDGGFIAGSNRPEDYGEQPPEVEARR